MAIYLADLIAKVHPDVESQVKRVRDQSRSILQDALRTECRLVMKTPEESDDNRGGAQVAVEIAPGHPAILNDLTFPDDLKRILLISRYRNELEQARVGVAGMMELHDELLRIPNSESWVDLSDEELRYTADWASFLLDKLKRQDPLEQVLAVREDFLGVYQYNVSNGLFDDDFSVNRAGIKLYWGVIGLVSEWMGCSVQDLTIVVLTHELAHAYTQLGADIEGRRWQAMNFARSEKGLIEGLAQYYTDRVLRRLERRYPGALKVYEKMLKTQPEEYRAHLEWVKNYSPEAVRRAMLEVRRWKERTLSGFNSRLEVAQKGLHSINRSNIN